MSRVWLALAAALLVTAPAPADAGKKGGRVAAKARRQARSVRAAPQRKDAKDVKDKARKDDGRAQANKGAGKGKPTRGKKRSPPPDPVRSRGEVVMPAPPAGDPDRARIEQLQQQLAMLLSRGPLARTRIGVEVRRLKDDRLLFSQNAGVQFDPASNEKILTTAAALTLLGPSWTYRTVLAGPRPRADGVIPGDVYLRGSGDPMLSFEHLVEIAREVQARGVTRIAGGIVVEETGYQSAGAPVDSSGEEDELGYAPLTLNRNRVVIRVSPGPIGGAPSVSVDPPVFHVQNSAKTVGRGRGLRVEIAGGPGAGLVRVSGKVARGTMLKRRPPKPALFTAATLGKVLADLGIVVDRPVRTGRVGKTELVLGSHDTPMSMAIRPSNIYSNNFYAERIFQTLGVEIYGAPATAEKGQKALAELMRRAGVSPSAYRAENGSGLAHCNRVTPAALAKLLRHVYYDLEVAPDFLSSLSVGGISGTTRRRFIGHPAAGLVRAKTGTLRSKSALSGYVGDKDDVLVFSIMADSFRHGRQNQVRSAQAYLVDAMLRFARGGSPEPLVFPPELEEEGEDGDDDEQAAAPAAKPGLTVAPRRPGVTAQPPRASTPEEDEADPRARRNSDDDDDGN